MTFNKYIRLILAACFLALISGAFYLYGFHVTKKDADEPVVQMMQQSFGEDTLADDMMDEDGTSQLDYDDAQWMEAPIFIDDIDPKTITTTAKLHEVFDRFMLYSIPTVEIEKLPADFVQNGDPNLFIKAVLPLTMRENQKIKNDRDFLLGLAVKMKNNVALTPEETVRFEKLTRTYDTFRKKLPAGQLAELLDKVDVVPNSLVIAQMGIQTNWGKTNAKAPFGQKEWKNGKYVFKEFDSLPKAVQSFMLEINSLPQYQNFRTQRKVYKNLRGSLSHRLIDYMTPFEPENATYIPLLKEVYKTYNLGPLDNALFWK